MQPSVFVPGKDNANHPVLFQPTQGFVPPSISRSVSESSLTRQALAVNNSSRQMSNNGRNNKGPRPCAIATFGFGGKLAIYTPKQGFNQRIYTRKVFDHLQRQLEIDQRSNYADEFSDMLQLLAVFSGE